MIFLGTLFPREREKELIELSVNGVSNAGNTFQWNIISGIKKNISTIINVLPVGTYPGKYRKVILNTIDWKYDGINCKEIGGINFPVIKQLTRYIGLRKALKKSDDREVLLCTAYLPFLAAVNCLPKQTKVTAIITDIPEFYDMHKVSSFRRLLRILHNKIVYYYMKRVDRFILLTHYMKDPLHVGERPYMVMEGIYNDSIDFTEKENSHKKALLYSGRLNERYGVKKLIEEFMEIDNSDLELWFRGSGELKDYIISASQKDKRIKFFGFVSRNTALELLQKADILINPRDNSGEYTKYSFPSKTMEYMASGKPVIMYKLDGIPDEYDDYLFYIQENISNAIKEKIEMVLEMPTEEVKRKASAGREFIIDKKNATVQAERIIEFINSGLK